MMKKVTSYGEAFRELRELRGIKLKDAANNIITPQFLSKFEKDQSSMSIENFGKLLVRLGVTWEDFLAYYYGENVESVINHFNTLLSSYTSDENLFRESQKQAEFLLKENPDLSTLFQDALRVYFVYGNELNWDITKEIKRIEDYLNYSDTWLTVEWIVYSLTLTIFPIEMIRYRTKKLCNSLEQDTSVPLHKKQDQFQTLFNTVRYFSREGYYQDADKLIQFLETELAKPKYMAFVNEQLLLKMQKTYHLFRMGDLAAFEIAKKCLRLMTMLEKDFNMEVMMNKAKDIFYWNIQNVNKTGKIFDITYDD